MIPIRSVIDLIKPLKVIGNIKGATISNAIQLNETNTSEEVIMWVSAKNIAKLEKIKSGVILCPSELPDNLNADCTYLLCDNPRLAFQKVLTAFFLPKPDKGILSTAAIDPSVKLGKDVFIGHHVVIESNCVVGDRTTIGHNTVIKKDTVIGDDVLIGSNNMIGGVGFGYEKDETGEYVLIPHIGNVVIHKNVEIGNNTCIDRAVMGSTVLFENVKIDNLVHIAHGVKVGKNSLVIANAMIAGSVEIGENVWVAPTASILNGLKIGDNSIIGLGAVVVKKVENDQIIVGNPGRPLDKTK